MAATKFYATDSDFFQVIRETKTTVTVRPVRSEFIDYGRVANAFDYEAVRRARANDFTTCWMFSDKQNESGKRCKKQTCNDSIIIDASYGVYAYPCSDTETFEVFYG